MDKEVLFTERQRFKQWWLWLILLGVNGLFLFGVSRPKIGLHELTCKRYEKIR